MYGLARAVPRCSAALNASSGHPQQPDTRQCPASVRGVSSGAFPAWRRLKAFALGVVQLAIAAACVDSHLKRVNGPLCEARHSETKFIGTTPLQHHQQWHVLTKIRPSVNFSRSSLEGSFSWFAYKILAPKRSSNSYLFNYKDARSVRLISRTNPALSTVGPTYPHGVAHLDP